jgi:hypothetical protein
MATDNLKFRVVWIGYDQEPVDEEACYKRDLTAAISYAARKVVKQPDAHGFFVERDRREGMSLRPRPGESAEDVIERVTKAAKAKAKL